MEGNRKKRLLLAMLGGLLVGIVVFGFFYVGFNFGGKSVCDNSGGVLLRDFKCHGIKVDAVACNDVVDGFILEKDLNINFSGVVLE